MDLLRVYARIHDDTFPALIFWTLYLALKMKIVYVLFVL